MDSFFKKLANIDHRYAYALLLIVVTLPLVFKIGIPLGEAKRSTRGFYETVEALPEGSRVVLCMDFRPAGKAEVAPMSQAFVKHAFAKGVRVIAWSGINEGAILTQSLLAPIAEEAGAVYGEDWINLGFAPGGNVNLKRMVDDFPAAVANTDFFGADMKTFPITADMESIADADLLVAFSSVTPGPNKYIEMVTIPTGLKMIAGTGSAAGPGQLKFYDSGQYKGFLLGLRGAAEYEAMTEYAGDALAGMDAQSLGHLLVIGLIVLGNLGELFTKKSKDQSKA